MDFKKPLTNKGPSSTNPSPSAVRVKLQMDTDTKKVWLLIQVRSQNKPKVWSNAKVDADSSRLQYDVSEAAERIACYQCTVFLDRHNPQAVAKAAQEALVEILSTAEKARRQYFGG